MPRWPNMPPACGGERAQPDGRKGGSASKFADADSEPPFGTITETGRLLTRDSTRRYDREATVAGNDPPGRRSRLAPYLPWGELPRPRRRTALTRADGP